MLEQEYGLPPRWVDDRSRDTAENALDCNAICDKYKECWNKDYDESRCRTNCRDKANSDNTFEAKVDMCAACVEDKSCAGTFGCVTECAPIVP